MGVWRVNEILEFGENNKIYEALEGYKYRDAGANDEDDDYAWDPG